jgi:hypothetical protein
LGDSLRIVGNRTSALKIQMVVCRTRNADD